jgi:saccharopepsin
LALNEAKGLEATTDGILGLAVNRDEDMKDASFLR